MNEDLEQALAFWQVHSARTGRQLRAMEDATLEVIIEVEDPDSEVVELAAFELRRRRSIRKFGAYRYKASSSVLRYFEEQEADQGDIAAIVEDARITFRRTADDRAGKTGEFFDAFGNYMTMAAAREMTVESS